MKARRILVAASFVLALWPAVHNAQTRTYVPPKTSDGKPDLQGVWTNVTITPLERPAEFKDKAFLTPQEAAAFEKQVVDRNNADRRDGGAEADVGRAYNDAWYDRGTRVVKTLRSSLVVDPPDGHIPAMLPDAANRQQERLAANRGHQFDGPENRSLAERCLIWPTLGPPMLPSFYNNNYQIVQGPGYVAILVEMIHDLRIIPTDGRPHLPSDIRLWMGDPRGHWEGNTLVVDTTNFTDKTAFRGSSQNLHLVERFTRTDADTVMYEVTVEDPSTWAKPWKIEIPMRKTEG
ncbi:MAG TPA: hypothetical protein VKY31_14765, partial [Terriglobia bacterium]|nr:hypothetical protein [Terriglobia bacterium]